MKIHFSGQCFTRPVETSRTPFLSGPIVELRVRDADHTPTQSRPSHRKYFAKFRPAPGPNVLLKKYLLSSLPPEQT